MMTAGEFLSFGGTTSEPDIWLGVTPTGIKYSDEIRFAGSSE